MASGSPTGSLAEYFGGSVVMRQRTHIFCFALLLLAGALPGCMVIEVGVSNPAPNLPRIAVAPFINLSSERSVDGVQFARFYQRELQKIPGFQVIPVGVVESAMHDHQLNLDSPEDLRKLTEILDVDGVCLGAVTEYSPYYPPRLGLQISWYTAGVADFQPGIPVSPLEKSARNKDSKGCGKTVGWSNAVLSKIPLVPCIPCRGNKEVSAFEQDSPQVVRAQNKTNNVNNDWDNALRIAMNVEPNAETGSPASGLRLPSPAGSQMIEPELAPQPELVDSIQPGQMMTAPALPVPLLVEPGQDGNMLQMPSGLYTEMPQYPQSVLSDPNYPEAGNSLQPYMSYTRIFNGADAKFTASLRNYLELGDDQRSGGTMGHLYRSEDFVQFCMYRSILEMLQLHGGESKRRFVLTSRKYQ